MIYTEEVKDLFSVPNDYYLVHCISADFGMGRGIVVEFNKRFNMKTRLQMLYPNYLQHWQTQGLWGDCIKVDRVLNLITKERYYHKPTYDSMESALVALRMTCNLYGIKKVAMPLIGCGLDKLSWNRVSDLIQQIFQDLDIEILVCRQ